MLTLSLMGAIRFVVAVMATIGGALALSLFRRRRYRGDLALLYFGLGASAYGIRLLLQAFERWYSTGTLLLTLFLPIPLILFLIETVAPEWRKATRWIIGANLGLAAFVLATLILRLNPRYGWFAIDVFSLIELPLIIAMTFLPRRVADRELRITRAGILIFLLFAILTNLQGLQVWRLGPNLEFVGFAIVLSCLGEVALRRMERNEERLLGLHKELEIARDIQSRLLPEPASTLGDLTVASRYIPATSVAGDFYDFLVKDGGLGVLIADVSGHGIPAALCASMVKVVVRAQMERADRPAEVLREMNSILCGNLQGQFVSAGYLFLDTEGRALTYAGAGHPPMLVWRAGPRHVESLEENGMLLGLFPNGDYSSRTLPLERGDRCLLYTDGLLEAPSSSGEEFGSDRLSSFLAEHASLPAQHFCDRLVDRVAEWQGRARDLHDDVTVVVVDFP